MFITTLGFSLFILLYCFSNVTYLSSGICSSNASKYFRRGTRLNWPEGALSRESIRAVKKLNRLKVRLSSLCYYNILPNCFASDLFVMLGGLIMPLLASTERLSDDNSLFITISRSSFLNMSTIQVPCWPTCYMVFWDLNRQSVSPRKKL